MLHVVDEMVISGQHPIRPEHIEAEWHFWDAFGNSETEVSARWVVRLCQARRGWYPFTGEEIEELYRSRGFEGFSFNRLVNGNYGFVMQCGDGRYRVTHEFICRCFAASPKGQLPFSAVVVGDGVGGSHTASA